MGQTLTQTTGMILQGLKPRLMRDLKYNAGAWVTEPSLVIWGLQTTPNRSTDLTPYFMVYGLEAALQSDLLHKSPLVDMYLEVEAEEAHQDGLDLLDEERELALIRSTAYQQDLHRYHDRHVRERAFQEGDLVL